MAAFDPLLLLVFGLFLFAILLSQCIKFFTLYKDELRAWRAKVKHQVLTRIALWRGRESPEQAVVEPSRNSVRSGNSREDGDSDEESETEEFREQVRAAEEEIRRNLQRQHQGQCCLILMVTAFVCVALLLLYLLGLANAGVWERIGEKRESYNPGPREEQGVAYCERLDVALLFGGRWGTEVFGNLRVFEFSSLIYYAVFQYDIENVLKEAFNPQVVEIESGAPDECMFLISGGIRNVLTGEGSDDVVLVRLKGRGYRTSFESDPDPEAFVTISKVNTTGDGPPPGLYAPSTISSFYKTGMVVLGGVMTSPGSQGKAFEKDLSRMSPKVYRLEMKPNSANTGFQEPYSGEWVSSDKTNASSYPLRYGAVNIANRDGRRWYMYGGYMNDGEISDDMYLINELGIWDEFTTFYRRANSRGQDVKLRRAFSAGAKASSTRAVDTIFVYGGERSVEGTVSLVDFVSISNMILTDSAPILECQASLTTYFWCAFTFEYPGTERYPVGITKDNSIYVWRTDGLYRFDMAQSLNGEVMGGYAAESGEGESWKLQYSLIAAALFVMTTVCVIYSNTYNVRDQYNVQAFIRQQQSRNQNKGVSQKTIDKIPLFRFMDDGNFVRVKAEKDENGETTYVAVEEDEHGDTAPPKDKPTEADEWGSEVGECCSLCLTEFENEEIIRKLPCEHFMHPECVDPWLKKEGSCPLCRQHVVAGKSVNNTSRPEQAAEYEEEAQREDRDQAVNSEDEDPVVDLESQARTSRSESRRASASRRASTASARRASIASARRASTASARSRARTSSRRRSGRPISERLVQRANQVQAELQAESEQQNNPAAERQDSNSFFSYLNQARTSMSNLFESQEGTSNNSGAVVVSSQAQRRSSRPRNRSNSSNSSREDYV